MNESFLPSIAPTSPPSAPGIYADLPTLTKLQFHTRGFSFLPRQPVHSILAGRHASRLRGRGLNFEEIRRYLPGDDIRNMDWRVTARLRSPHVRVYTEERERSVLLLVDQRITMFFGSQRNMKSVTAAECAALGAWRVLSQKDRIGAVVFNDREVIEHRPHRSQARVMEILQTIVRQNQALSLKARIPSRPGMLNEALRRAERLATHDFLVCVITDGTNDDEAETNRLMTSIAQHNDVLVGFIYDPFETDLPDAGPLVMSDGTRQLEVDTSRRALRESFRDTFAEKRAQTRRFLLHREVPVLPVSTAEDVATQLRRHLSATRP